MEATFPFQLTLLLLLLLFKAKVVSLKQKGGGKEFELRSQTPTKQPWTQINHSFAFYEAAFFQWLLFDHICLNKACHNLRKVYVYNKHNTTWKVLCTVFTHSLFCIRNLTRSLRSLVRFLIRHNSWVNTVRTHFPWSILYLCSSGKRILHRASPFSLEPLLSER